MTRLELNAIRALPATIVRVVIPETVADVRRD